MRGYDSTMPTFTVTRGGALVALGGTPGGHRQVQTNVQVLTTLLPPAATGQPTDVRVDPQPGPRPWP